MKVVVIEDEKLSAEHLARLLAKIEPTAQILAHWDSVRKSVQELKKGLSCDLMFMDIHLADGLSFEIFAQVPIETQVIFTTAYDEYAVKAFKVNSVDYLLKPITEQDLKAAVEKFKRHKPQAIETRRDNQENAFAQYQRQYKNRFMVKMGETISSVKAEDVSHFVSEDGLVLLVSKDKRRCAINFNLDQLEELLSPNDFFRINRKTVVHIDSVEKVSTYFNSRLKVQVQGLDDEAAVVSRERVGSFKEWLDR